jgi:hypothetical protein
VDPRRRQVLFAALADVIAVILFVVLGRRSHDEGSTLSGILGVAGPFLIGLAAGWGVARAWRTPMALRTGVIVWVVTVALGMVLRHWVWDRGTAASFIIVATLVLGTFLVGWRAVARLALTRGS